MSLVYVSFSSDMLIGFFRHILSKTAMANIYVYIMSYKNTKMKIIYARKSHEREYSTWLESTVDLYMGIP